MTENTNTWCVIMAGGGGTRFWPISTADSPKQFLGIMGTEYTFLQSTARRFSDIVPWERILVVTTRKYFDKVRFQLPQIPLENIIQEPYARDTAGCVALAAYTIVRRDPNAQMIVAPSDHIILDEDRFRSVISHMVEELKSYDVLATIGITPTRPDTNYGYIQVDGAPEEFKPIKVKTFTEKPDRQLAQTFLDSGDFLWNSGIFIWKAQTIIDELERYVPHLVSQFAGWEVALGTASENDFLDRVYADLPKISIDNAVMERTDNAWTMPASFGWYDIGTFDSLYESFSRKDKDGNCPRGTTKLTRDSRNNFLYSSERSKLVAVSALEDYVVIDTPKVLLVCPRDEKAIRELKAGLAEEGMDEYK